MMRTRVLYCVTILALLTGCADSTDSATPARSKSKSAEGDIAQLAAYPVIVRVGGREQNVIVRAGPTCPLVSVTDANGREMISGVTMDELRRDHPDSYRLLNGTATTGELDASIDIAGE
jgi:hypothetical protein